MGPNVQALEQALQVALRERNSLATRLQELCGRNAGLEQSVAVRFGFAGSPGERSAHTADPTPSAFLSAL
jgi:hypothetical protein